MERKIAAGVVATAAEWLCHERYGPRFPKGMLSILAGWPGQGKSAFSRDLAATVSQDARVAMANTEDAEGAIRLALEIAGAKLENIEFIEPDLQRDVTGFCDYLRAERIALCVLDPIAALFGGLIYQEAEFRLLFKEIKVALEDTACSLVGIHHTIGNLPKNAHPLKALGGPQGSLKGTARSIWIFGCSPDEGESERVVAHVKDNCGTTTQSMILEMGTEDVFLPGRPTAVTVPKLHVLNLESSIKASEVIHANSDSAKQKKEKESVAGEFLVETLCLGELPQKLVFEEARMLGISRPTVQRAAAALKLAKRQGDDKVIYWALPADHPALINSITQEDIDQLLASDDD